MSQGWRPKLRIGVLAHQRHPIAQPYQGGLEAHTAMLADELTDRGHEVVLVARAGSRTRARLLPLLPAELGRHQLPGTPGRRCWDTVADPELAAACAELSGEVDVFVNNSLSAVPYRLLAEHPVLTVLHTPATLPHVLDVVADPTWRPGRHHTFAGVSRTTTRDWARWLPAVQAITNGVDLRHWAGDRERRGRGGGRVRGRRHAVWSGRITPEKGLVVAIQAAQLAGWELSISGPVADPAYFSAEIAPRLSPTIRYAGHLSHAELPAFLRSGSVYLFTPLWPEPFGLSLVEALATGTPAAALPHGAVHEIVGPTSGVVAPDVTPASLAAAMEQARRLDRVEVAASVGRFALSGMVDAYEGLLVDLHRRSTPVRSIDGGLTCR